MPGEESWPTQPLSDQPAAAWPKQSFGVDDISPLSAGRRGRRVQEASARRPRTRASSRPSATPTRCTFRRATAACSSAAWRPNPARAPSTSSHMTTRASFDCCGPARTPAAVAAARRRRPVRLCISRTARRATARIGWARPTGVPLVHAAADPANNIARRRPAIRRGCDSRRRRRRQGTDACLPAPHDRGRRRARHVPDDRTRRARAGAVDAGAAAVRPGPGAPPELIVGSGSVSTRPDAAGRAAGAAPCRPIRTVSRSSSGR